MPKTLVRKKIQPPVRKKLPTTFISQTEAKNRFLTHCRHVIDTGEYVCVQDKSETAYLTLTTRKVKDVFVTESAQFFKDNFARCSSLIRDGVAFRLTLRGSNSVVYARRHTSYIDPVDNVIEKWRESIVEAAVANADESAIQQLSRDLAALAQDHRSRNEEDREVALDRYKNMVRGIARMAIGHLPFENGQVPQQRDPVQPSTPSH